MLNIALADVLEGYAVETPNGNDLVILQKWIERYPQYALDLMDFAATRSFVTHTPDEDLSVDEERSLREKSNNNLNLVLKDYGFQEQKDYDFQEQFIESLVKKAEEKGLSRSMFASAIGLSLSLLMYLEKRRIGSSTIPKAIIKRIANVLETTEELVSAYLYNQPRLNILAARVSYKTDKRPEEPKLKNFFEAVKEDQVLSAEDKKKLLSLE